MAADEPHHGLSDRRMRSAITPRDLGGQKLAAEERKVTESCPSNDVVRIVSCGRFQERFRLLGATLQRTHKAVHDEPEEGKDFENPLDKDPPCNYA